MLKEIAAIVSISTIADLRQSNVIRSLAIYPPAKARDVKLKLP
jgi:hypothetical protein